MQSTGSKSKRSRKTAEEPKVAASPAPATAAEETTKIRRKSTAKKSTAEATPAAKRRGAAKKSVAPAPDSSDRLPSMEEKSTIAGPPSVNHADIAMLAYSYWAERGYQGGSAEEDWFRAEKHLLSR